MLSNDVIIPLASVFAGFLVARLSSYFDYIFSRRKLHYNTLISLESRLHQLSEDINVAKTKLESVENAWKTQHPSGDEPILELFDREIIHGLLDVELKNKLLNFLIISHRVSGDLRTIRKGNADIRKLFTSKTINRLEYSQATKYYLEQIPGLQKFLTELAHRNLKLIAYIRLRIRFDKPPYQRIGLLTVRTIPETAVNHELSSLRNQQ